MQEIDGIVYYGDEEPVPPCAKCKELEQFLIEALVSHQKLNDDVKHDETWWLLYRKVNSLGLNKRYSEALQEVSDE